MQNISKKPAGIYFFKVNNGKNRKMYEICSKLTIKTPEYVHDVALVSLMSILKRFPISF